MRRNLLQSPAFVRAARRQVKKHPEIASILRAAFAALVEDAFQPAMKTHKLKGELAGLWACNIGYVLRIIFEIVQHEGVESVVVQTVGAHDEVY